MLWLHAVKTLKQSENNKAAVYHTVGRFHPWITHLTFFLKVWLFCFFFPGMCIHAFSHLSRAAKITCYFLNLFTSFKYNWRPQLSWLSTFLFGLNGFAPSTNYNSPSALQDSRCEYLWETSFPPFGFSKKARGSSDIECWSYMVLVQL